MLLVRHQEVFQGLPKGRLENDRRQAERPEEHVHTLVKTSVPLQPICVQDPFMGRVEILAIQTMATQY